MLKWRPWQITLGVPTESDTELNRATFIRNTRKLSIQRYKSNCLARAEWLPIALTRHYRQPKHFSADTSLECCIKASVPGNNDRSFMALYIPLAETWLDYTTYLCSFEFNFFIADLELPPVS